MFAGNVSRDEMLELELVLMRNIARCDGAIRGLLYSTLHELLVILLHYFSLCSSSPSSSFPFLLNCASHLNCSWALTTSKEANTIDEESRSMHMKIVFMNHGRRRGEECDHCCLCD